MYDSYVFDLYGTLVDIKTDETKKVVWKQMALFYRYSGIVYNWEELKEMFFQYCQREERRQKYDNTSKFFQETYAEIKIENVFKKLYTAKGVEPDDELVYKTAVHFRRITIQRLKLYKGARELLEAIRNSGKKLYLLTNAQRVFTEFEINSLDIAKYFDGIIISSDEGVKKPDKKFFDILKDRYDVDFSKAIMIGNDAGSDVNGAKKVGMDAMYIHSNISPADDKTPNCKYVLEKMNLKQAGKLLLE